MKKNQGYFLISRKHLPDNHISFPFDIFLYSSKNDTYSLFLRGNSPLNKERKEILDICVDRGAIIAIKIDQRKTFLYSCDLTEKDLEVHENKEIEELNVLMARVDNVENAEKFENTNQDFDLNNEIVKAFDIDDFMPIINQVKKEISLFPLTVSHTVSLAKDLSQKLMIADNRTNRIVTLSYLLAKTNGFSGAEQLGDLVVAAFLHEIGTTQVDAYLTSMPSLELFDKERNTFMKRTALTQHLIRKCGIDISDKAMKIILEHTERADGSGYPNMKKHHSIVGGALILGIVNHLIRFSEGAITGKEMKMSRLLKIFEKGDMMPGLEYEFGDKNKENVVYLWAERQRKADEAA